MKRRPVALALALTTAATPAAAQPTAPGTPPVAQPAPPAAPGTPAAAERDVVVVLPITVRDVPDGHLARDLENRVAAGLRRAGLTAVAADVVRARVPAGACGPECLRGAVAGTGARWLVRTEIVVEGRDYNVQLVLLRADTGQIALTSADQCEICGYEELGEIVGDLAYALQRKLAAAAVPPPRLQVFTRPDGSTVLVDGAVVGVTPLDITVAAGAHEVVIERPGYVSHRRRITAADGVTETIGTELGPVPPPDQPPREQPRRRLAPIGWAAVGVGLAGLIAGTALITIDERPIQRDCSGMNVDAFGTCKWRHDTLAGGATLAALGVAALATGVALLVVDRRRSRPTPARATVRPHPGGLLVRF